MGRLLRCKDERLFITDGGAVSGFETLSVQREFAGDHLQPSVAARRERVLNLSAGIELAHEEICISVDLQLALATGRRSHQFQRSRAWNITRRYLVVLRRYIAAFWQDPDLQQMDRFGF